MSTTQAITNESRCAFLSLPPELCNQIYELALTHEPFVNIRRRNLTRGSEYIEPALTRTCRLIRNESLNIFYDANVFRFDCWKEETFKLRFISQDIGKLNIIEICADFCEHLDFFRLDVSQGLANYQLDLRPFIYSDGTPTKISSYCLNHKYLARGREYLGSCITGPNSCQSLTGEVFEKLLAILLGQSQVSLVGDQLRDIQI